MSVIDKKGKLFGKLNIIDLLAILLIVAVLALIGYKLTSNSGGLAGAGRAIGYQRAVNVEHSRFDLHANHPFRRPRRRRFRRSFPPLRPA